MADRREHHLRFKVIDVLHGLRCRGRVMHCADGILCLLCGREWWCPCEDRTVPVEPRCTVCGVTDAACIDTDGGCCEGCRATAGCSHESEADAQERLLPDLERSS